MPEPRSRARLGPPLQIRGDADAARTSTRPEAGGIPNAMLLPVLDLDVVGAPTPSPPGSQSERHAELAPGDGPVHVDGTMIPQRRCDRPTARGH